MSVQHHGASPFSEQPTEKLSIMKKFLEQVEGRARREYPQGKLGCDDLGSLAVAMAADPKAGVIRIDFGKPVEWIGLRLEDAEALRDMLTEKMMELRGISVN